MASGGSPFPPQKQEKQPGKEHVMDPHPQYADPNYKPSNKLRGKVAVVTGGDSGIGRAVCNYFALEGATVAFTYVKFQEDKDAKDTLQILKKIKTPEAKAPIAIPTDLGFDENCKKVVDEVVKAFGRIDVLVNNAAEQYKVSSMEEIDEERLLRVFRTNIFSYFFMVRHALKHMHKGSSIVNTTSVNAYRGHPTLIEYTSTKGAILAFTRALAVHLVEREIRVNGVAPGRIWTPLIPSSFEEEECEIWDEGADGQGRAAQRGCAVLCVSCLQCGLLLHYGPSHPPQRLMNIEHHLGRDLSLSTLLRVLVGSTLQLFC